jgi:hypothetical protein
MLSAVNKVSFFFFSPAFIEVKNKRGKLTVDVTESSSS